MNELLKKLAEQAGFYNMGIGLIIGIEEYHQKFGELIVRECAQVSEDDITDGDACCTNTAYRISRQIKKHFGVEE